MCASGPASHDGGGALRKKRMHRSWSFLHSLTEKREHVHDLVNEGPIRKEGRRMKTGLIAFLKPNKKHIFKKGP